MGSNREELVLCPIENCNMEVAKYRLKIHMKSHLSCPQCGQIFNKKNKKRDLEAHMKRHEMQSQLTCQYCDKNYNFKSKLLIHQKTCKMRKCSDKKQKRKISK